MARRSARLLVAVALCLALAFVVVRSALVALALDADRPPRLPGLLGGDPRLALSSAVSSLEVSGGTVDDAVMARVGEAFEEAPLADEPFTIAGIKALLAGDDATAERLLEEARRRHPRGRVVRLLLLDIYGRADRGRDAVGEMAVLSRLIPGAQAQLLPEMAKMAARHSDARQRLATILRSDPDFRAAVLRHLAAERADPELIIQLAGNEPRKPGAPFPPWQGQLVTSLVESGDIARAKAVWARLTGHKPGASGVNDGRFEQRFGLAPFSWTLSETPEGVAESGRGRGLLVRYYGRQDTILAEQLLTLPPGRVYTLSYRLEGGAAEGGGLSWRLTCLKGNEPFADIPVGARGAAAQFSLPSDCPAQWLRLAGTSTEFAREQQIAISEIGIGERPK